MDIKLNKIGRIKKGEEKGWFVKILDDSENTGGYLIFIFNSLDKKQPNYEAYDNWVETLEDLQSYFEESLWDIEWLKNDK